VIKRSMRIRCRPDDERGVVAVMLALFLTLVLGICALVIDLGNARQLRREAQASADAAALAGGEAIESDTHVRVDGTFTWSTVVTQIKNYAKANDNIATSAWANCSDPYKLAYRPDAANNDTCISASASSFPAPSASSIGDNVMYLRVRLPSSSVKSYFAKALGNGDLTVGATSTTKVVFTVTQLTTPASGGPCALCILGNGYTLDGQNGDVTITGGDVVVDSSYKGGSCNCAAELNPNGHVTLTTTGGTIGGPGAPGNFNGSGFSPTPTYHAWIPDPLAWLNQCGDGSHSTDNGVTFVSGTNYCPTTAGDTANANKNNKDLSPGIYSTISGSHKLSAGIYVITGGITLSGSDLIQGDGVMLYFACSNYPTPCNGNQVGAGVTATGNGALRLTGYTNSGCAAGVTTGICQYVGMLSFADRNNSATQTWRGNGTNELGQASAISGTIYLANGTMDLRGNGYQMASQIVTSIFTMNGNPSTVTISYDLPKNVGGETHGVATYSGTPDNNGLSG
jgi:hypothetical protein